MIFYFFIRVYRECCFREISNYVVSACQASSGRFIYVKWRRLCCFCRERDDAVRQIMHDLLNPTDHEKNDLAEELSNLHSHRVDHLCWEERITKTPSAWCPDSRETNPSKGGFRFCFKFFSQLYHRPVRGDFQYCLQIVVGTLH